jgi:hypothetical protein
MTRERLEVLSFESLKKLAQQEGIDVPEDVEKILLVDLIFEVLAEKKEEREQHNNNPVRVQQKKFDVSLSEELDDDSEMDVNSLPERYNETRIVLMFRDPFWAFVYWDIQGGLLKTVKKEFDAESVFLRVIRLAGPEFDKQDPRDLPGRSFNIPINSDDSSWYINIPEQDCWYCVELVFQGRQQEAIIGRSNVIRVPRAVIFENLLLRDGTPMDTILSLSGVEKLDMPIPVIKNPRRISSINEETFLH